MTALRSNEQYIERLSHQGVYTINKTRTKMKIFFSVQIG
jgi:hypothetical protein